MGNINLICHMIRKQTFFIFWKLKNQCLSIPFVTKTIYLINIDFVNDYIFNACIHRVAPSFKVIKKIEIKVKTTFTSIFVYPNYMFANFCSIFFSHFCLFSTLLILNMFKLIQFTFFIPDFLNVPFISAFFKAFP